MIRLAHFKTMTMVSIGLGCLLLLTGGCTFATVVPLERAQAVNAGFDAGAYVDGIWESQLLPAYDADAPDVTMLLARLAENEEAAIEEFGHRSGTGPFSFMARGEGQVVEVDTSSQAGIVRLDLPPYDETADVALTIGPVIRGNAIRDAAGFIEYNQFTNQMEFAAVYREMNNRVRDDLLSQYDFENMATGTRLSFVGAFTLEGEEYVVVPVRLEVQE